MATAFKNPDRSIAVVVFNLTEAAMTYALKLAEDSILIDIKGPALQTFVIR